MALLLLVYVLCSLTNDICFTTLFPDSASSSLLPAQSAIGDEAKRGGDHLLSPASIPLPQYLAKAPQLPGKPQSCVTEIHIINSTITMAGHDINQTINNISLDAHFDEKLIDRKFQAKQAEFLKKKNHSRFNTSTFVNS